MAMDQTKAGKILLTWGEMKEKRTRNWDNLFQQCKDVVWPNSNDFTVTRQPGTYLVELIYDSTAPWANNQFANGMHAAVANPFEQWFRIRFQDDKLNKDLGNLVWLDDLTDLIANCYLHAQANHKQSLHSYFLGTGCLGTASVCQEWDEEIDGPCFSSVPLANLWIAVDNSGRVNKVYRKVVWSKRQAIERFKEENLPPKLVDPKVKMDGEKYIFIHAVEPRKKRNPNGKGAKDMAFASTWIFVGGAIEGSGGSQPAASEDPWVCWEGGYRTMPYHVGRWEVIEEQEYGRSPAMDALPVIRVTNQNEKVALRADQKNTDPAMIAPHDAFMSQLDQTPGAVNYYDSSAGLPTDAFRPLSPPVNLSQSSERQEERRGVIKQLFYADLGNIPFKKERQTTAEIQAQQDSLLRSIAPLVGRQEAELLGPMIMRTYDLLSMWGKLPPPPNGIHPSKKLKIEYVSRAAQAIKSGKLAAIKSFIAETIVPMIQLAPEAKDSLNVDAVIAESAALSNVSMDIFRTPQEVAAIRQDRAKQQQQQQQLAAAESASTSLKNVGQAAQASPQLVGAQP